MSVSGLLEGQVSAGRGLSAGPLPSVSITVYILIAVAFLIVAIAYRYKRPITKSSLKAFIQGRSKTKALNPYFLFLIASIVILLALIVFNQRAAAIVMGTVLASIIDLPLLITGLVLGFVGKSYRQFSMIAYPIAVTVAVLEILITVNPWLSELGRSPAGPKIYFAKIYAMIFIAHIIQLIRQHPKVLSWIGHERKD